MRAVRTLVLLALAACHAPAPADPQAPAQAPADPYQQPDDGFDLFEDEDANAGEGARGEPFTEEILQARVAEILPRVEQLRGMKFLRPVPAGLQNRDEFIAFAMAEFEREYGLEAFAATAESYRLLGLIPSEMDLLATTTELLREQVGGYYDPRTEAFYMMDQYRQGALADIILAHELTHALDDQHFDLDALMAQAETADEEFAIRAVVEGSGTSLMNLYGIQGALQGWLELDPSLMMEEMEGQAETLREAPPYLVMTLALPYLEGNKLLTRKTGMLEAAMAQPTLDDLRAAFADPPRSSEQVLHFKKYWDPAQADEPVPVTLPDLVAVLGAGWALQDEDVLGELGCFVMTAERLPDLASPTGQMAGTWTNEAATGWGGDRYHSFIGPDGARLLVWDSVWDHERDALEFAEALQRDPAPANPFLRVVARAGLRVRAVFANEAADEALAAVRALPLDAAGEGR